MISATLVTDGSSDRVLVPILRWTMTQLTPDAIDLRWADLRGLAEVAPTSLRGRIDLATDLHPCQLLFVHRDAESADPDPRFAEIQAANVTATPHVCVVPVRMTEAWLLHDQAKLREAAGRPSGTEPLDLPRAARIEALPNPKQVLHDALRAANAARGRRAEKFRPEKAVHRLAEIIDDWSPLRSFAAFRRVESDTRQALVALGATLTG